MGCTKGLILPFVGALHAVVLKLRFSLPLLQKLTSTTEKLNITYK